MTIGIYGGSFDPPHVGHLMVAAYILSSSALDEVWVIPAFGHPFGKRSAPFQQRLAMCEDTFRHLKQCRVLDIEAHMGSSTVRTFDVLTRLQETCRDPMRLVIGADILADAHRWHRWSELVALAPPLVVGRRGYEGGDVPAFAPELSSSEVRRCCAAGEDASTFVDAQVWTRIRENGLYA